MKKSVINEAHKILDLMGRVTLTELNQKYLDQLLDKINDSGMESLSDYEKMALEKMSNDEDIEPPQSLGQTEETLRFTPENQMDKKPLYRPFDVGQLSGEPNLKRAKLTDDIVSMIESTQGVFATKPIFIDGNLGELDKPEDEQQIRMILKNGEYECVATIMGDKYLIRLKEESDFGDDDNDGGIPELNEDMNEYKVFDSGEMNEPLDMSNTNEEMSFEEARNKAKEDGKDTFEFEGQAYRIPKNMTQGFKLDEGKKMKGEDPCWDSYEMVGKKKKGGKEVPNCVPKKSDVNEESKGGIPERYKNKGFTKVGVKKTAPSGAKHKWEVLAKKGDQYKIVKGGHRGMDDYSQHKDKDRKEKFWDRMGGKDSAKANDPFSPLYWHKKFGTW